MALTGQAKTEYQRSYMRRRRSNADSTERSNKEPISVRPITLPIRPMRRECRAPYGESCACFKCQMNERDLREVKLQSHNPLMVGYVPKVGG